MKNVTATCNLWLEIIRGDSKRSSHVCLSSRPRRSFDKRIADLDFSLVRWPVLKIIEFMGYYPYLSMVGKIMQYSRRLFDSEDSPTLEKIIVNVSYSLERVFAQFPIYATIEEFTFNPKENIKSNGKYFFFDDSEKECSKINNGIIAPDLTSISQNVDLKKSLWAQLQSIYR